MVSLAAGVVVVLVLLVLFLFGPPVAVLPPQGCARTATTQGVRLAGGGQGKGALTQRASGA